MTKKDTQALLNHLAQVVFDKKGTNILVLDTKKSSNLTDYVLIAEGGADRHVIAQADAIVEELEKEGVGLSYQQGINTGEWVVLDFSWLIVHLFTPGVRDKYNLEGLWPEADIVDVEISVFDPESSAAS